MKCFALLVFAALAAPAAWASDESAPTLDVSEPFDKQHERLRASLADGETYREITPRQRTEVNEALSRIASRLDGGGTLEQLAAEERTQLYNDQELVNTILTQARADSRMICTRETKVGSHRPISTCLTVAERRRLQEQSQALIRSSQRVIQRPVTP
jgi:hypothetical protein